MKAFAHLSLLTLLFVTSAISQNTTTASTNTTITTASTTAPTNTTITTAPTNTTITTAPTNTTITTAPTNTTITTAPTNTTITAAPTNNTITAAPTNNSTTAAPTNNTTTAAPTNNSTTAAPTNNTTTAAPTNNSTTAAPTNNTTTAAPTNTTTTAAPTNNTITAAPTNNTTTAAPTNNSTTAAPTNNTTTAAPTNTTTTTAPTNNTITAAPTNTTSTAAPATTTTTSSVISPGLCKEDSCSSGASCVGLNNSYFCLCTDGYYYNFSTCNKGKVFPGTIKVKVPETSGLKDEKSPAYQNLYVEITKFFKDAFQNPDYGQTVIHKVRTSAPARSEMRAGDELVDVTVVNLFAETSEENETTISNAINEAVVSNPTFSDYTKENRCDFYGCVNEQDDCREILVCKCKPGLSRPNPQTALCLALGSTCLDTCNAEHNMQCLVHSNGRSECVCLPGYQKDAKESCQACAFGYSGVDCKDSFQLILTIVGTIAGILILGMVIALIFLRSKTKGIEEQNLIEDDYHSLRMSTTGFSNLGAEGSLFPKVRATFPKDSSAQNPYAPRSMPRPDY